MLLNVYDYNGYTLIALSDEYFGRATLTSEIGGEA